MPSEYTAKYGHLSHEELYHMLKAGNPGQVDAAAAGWTVLQQRADALVSALDADLRGLAANWSSTSGQEYQRRVGLVSQFTGGLSEDFGVMRGQLTSLAGDLRRAQSRAEDPANVNPNHTLTDAAKGAAIGSFAGPPGTFVGGLIGALQGHDADEAEKEKARQRMIQVVADLAGSYAVVGTARWDSPPVLPPPDLPGGSRSGFGAAEADPYRSSGVYASGVHGLGPAGSTGQHRAPDPSDSSTVADLGTSTGGPDSRSGTGPATASVALLGLGLVDVAALDLALGRAGMAGPPAQSITGGVSGAANPVTEGVIGGDSRAPAGKAAAGLRAGSVADEHVSAANSGRGQGDEPDEHLTWLTEDDLVWGGGEPIAPAVVGGPEPPEE